MRMRLCAIQSIVVLGLIASSASCGRAGAKPPAEAKGEAVDAGRPGATVAASPPVHVSPNPATIGALFGDKTLSAATPDNIRQKVAVAVQLKSEGPQDGQWTFRGESTSKEFPLAKAQFDEVEKGHWQLAQLYMVFRPAGGTRAFFDTLAAQLKMKLGKPKEAKKTGPNARRTEWKLGKRLFVYVEESVDPDHGPDVSVALYVPDGDPD